MYFYGFSLVVHWTLQPNKSTLTLAIFLTYEVIKHISARRYFCGSCQTKFGAGGSNPEVCDSFAIAVVMGDPASLPAVPPEPAWRGPSRRWEGPGFVTCVLLVAPMPLKILVSCHDASHVQGRTCGALWGRQQWQRCRPVVKGELNAAFPWQSLCVSQQFLKSRAKRGDTNPLRSQGFNHTAGPHSHIDQPLCCCCALILLR